MTGIMENPFSRWNSRQSELDSLAHPLLESRAVQRLANVSFLGILSPRFRQQVDSPLRTTAKWGRVDDGSRYEHSLGVALLSLELARNFGFSQSGQCYAVAWGLTHDIATWPLSHTSEPAFSAATGVSANNLRTGMLLDNPAVPGHFHLASILREMGINPFVLASLFDRTTTPDDEELAILKQVIRSPLTPDTLEGIWRCGRVFDVSILPPEEMVSLLLRDRNQACVDGRKISSVIDFWRGKGTIYEQFINREDVMLWESAWTELLQRVCGEVSLLESLDFNEAELVGLANRQRLSSTAHIIRYKEPQEYIITAALDKLPPEPPVSELWRLLRREPIGTSHE